MARFSKESTDRFIEHNIHIESRTIFLGDNSEGEIDAGVANSFIKAMHLMIEASNEKPIKLFINSFGGCWFSGMAIFDCIQACPVEVTAAIIGSAMSMGSIIVQAADVRLIYPNATMMVHDGYESRVGDTPQTFQNWAEFSKATASKMYAIYAERTKRKPSFWRQKCKSDLILSSAQALEYGLVDQIMGVAQ